jgi:hypothetical protein
MAGRLDSITMARIRDGMTEQANWVIMVGLGFQVIGSITRISGKRQIGVISP